MTSPAAFFSSAREPSCCKAARAAASSPVVATAKLTPVSGISAKENPATTFTAQNSGTSAFHLAGECFERAHRLAAVAGAGGRPHDRRMLPVGARHLACGQRALQKFGGDLGGGAAVGVRIFAKGDEAVGVIGHALGEIGMRIEDAEDGHVGPTRCRSRARISPSTSGNDCETIAPCRTR